MQNTAKSGLKEGQRRIAAIGDEGLWAKLKLIAYWKRIRIQDALNAALGDYVRKYEDENGEVQPKPEL